MKLGDALNAVLRTYVTSSEASPRGTCKIRGGNLQEHMSPLVEGCTSTCNLQRFNLAATRSPFCFLSLQGRQGKARVCIVRKANLLIYHPAPPPPSPPSYYHPALQVAAGGGASWPSWSTGHCQWSTWTNLLNHNF